MRTYNFIDKMIQQFDEALKTVISPQRRIAERPCPGHDHPEHLLLSSQDKKHIAGLMRVNHAGEVCAQALYQGQALTAKHPEIREHMMQAAAEEVDHLAWCEQRLRELAAHPSYLNLFWYTGSLLLGVITGLMGDAVSLGFVAETERQVIAHLQSHLEKIPLEDKRSLAILAQMKIDEAGHAATALASGGIVLPEVIQNLMRLTARVMTKTSYFF